jgi:hypothetical protein
MKTIREPDSSGTGQRVHHRSAAATVTHFTERLALLGYR